MEAFLEGGYSHAEVCSFNKYLLTLLCAASGYKRAKQVFLPSGSFRFSSQTHTHWDSP